MDIGTSKAAKPRIGPAGVHPAKGIEPFMPWAVAILFGFGIALRVGLLIAYRPAFLGIPDSGTYIQAAHTGLFSDPVDPVGYALFLRFLHLFGGGLFTVVLVQHLLGVATAGLLFTVGRHAGAPWAGLLAAGTVLLNGLQIWLEHTPMSDSLFTFLCVLTLFLSVRARDPDRWRLVLLGFVLGAAPIVRSVGVVLIPLTLAWLLVTTPGSAARRIARTATPVVLACAIVLGYAAVQQDHSGVFGLTAADGRVEYAVAARFADCSKFNPPPGTRGLCQTIPPGRRGSFNQYLWGFPDGASRLPPGGRAAVSPAWRLFGPMPGGNGKLGAFGRAAILHQPGAFLAQAGRNLSRYWTASSMVYVNGAAAPDADVTDTATAYYGGRTTVHRAGFSVFESYAHRLELGGWPMLILLFASPLALIAPNRRRRAVGVLFGAGGWLLLAGSALVAADPRYTLAGIGPLALAAAIGIGEVARALPVPR